MEYQASKITIIKAGQKEIHQVSELFNKYREFYGQNSDIASATTFISDRIVNNESVIFLALEIVKDTKIPVGFIQMYPSYSSVSMKRLWILNDLYVDKSQRRRGIGKHLMDQAKTFAIDDGAKGITICTSIDNHSAQKLYEAIGYTKNDKFYYYYCYFNK